ncbi:hypothetical protein PoB_006769600 [Plakobranchus ocellatus]|uniref:Uncharacterized protein n=1 Tax=Plakobranchus ocellatus TaxID=259542 RepID=A0AAV4DB88_9GAST|nr:hypothetical protein PoB_006769600 [Plakobranchus ocellatus]
MKGFICGNSENVFSPNTDSNDSFSALQYLRCLVIYVKHNNMGTKSHGVPVTGKRPGIGLQYKSFVQVWKLSTGGSVRRDFKSLKLASHAAVHATLLGTLTV